MDNRMRQCLGCQEWKPLASSYPVDAKSGGGYRARCNACMNAAKRAKRVAENPWKYAAEPFCGAAAMKEWGRHTDAPRLQLFGIVELAA